MIGRQTKGVHNVADIVQSGAMAMHQVAISICWIEFSFGWTVANSEQTAYFVLQ